MDNRKFWIQLLFSFMSLCSISCVQLNNEAKLIKNDLNKIVDLTMFDSVQNCHGKISLKAFRDKFEFISIVNLKKGCSVCYENYIKWNKGVKKMHINKNYTVLFLVKENEYSDFKNRVDSIEIVPHDFFVAIDSEYMFNEKNSHISNWVIRNSILINREGKVKLVGEPFNSSKMISLFGSVCSGCIK